MDTKIEVCIKNVYGRNKCYPINDQALRLAAMTGCRTLTSRHLFQAQDMGFTIVEVGSGASWQDAE